MRRFLSLLLMLSSAASATFAADTAPADPTRPSGFSESASTHENTGAKLTLTLIRLGAEPHAVINGKTVAPGESIAGHRLLSLQTTNATLSGPNGRTVLQLAPTIRKSSSLNSVQKR